MAQLLLLAPRLVSHALGVGLHVGQHVGAVGKVAPDIVQKGIGGDRELGRVDAVHFQRVMQEQVALHQVARVQAASQDQKDRQQADPQNEAP
ncbi:hypothetical protein D3C85_1097570 [compost metagenome]